MGGKKASKKENNKINSSYFQSFTAVLFSDCFQKVQRERRRVPNRPKMGEFVLRLNKPLVQVALNSRSVSALYYQTTSDFCSFSFVFLFRGLFLKEDCVNRTSSISGKVNKILRREDQG